MTIKQARKLLGKLGNQLSDEELKAEIEFSQFLAEILLKAYKQNGQLKSNYTCNK